MVATISETTNQTRPRPPLLSYEKDHAIIPPNQSTKPKSRHVSSSYSSPSHSNSPSSSSISRTPTPSRRFPSPVISRNSSTPAAKRPVSADRRRPTRPDLNPKPNNAAGEVSAATKLLVTSSRSLSVSFQGEAFSLPISKTKAPPTPNSSSVRKGTPLRGKLENGGRDHVENTKPMDQHRWPCRTREDNHITMSKNSSLNCGDEKSKVLESGHGNRALNRSMSDGGRLNLELLKPIRRNPYGNLVKDSSIVHPGPISFNTDTVRVSSCSTSSVQENVELARLRNVPTKIWQETNSRTRRLQDPGSPLSTNPGSKLAASPRFGLSKKLSSESPLSSPRTMAPPSRTRPMSPSKFMTSSVILPPRGMTSPRRNSVSGSKVGENRIVNAHILRLLHNRQLQWRFVNARTEDTLLKRKRNAEKYLWNAWVTTSDLHDSVTKKRHRLQLLRQKLKLASILKQQIAFLETWACLDKDHSRSLLGATEALKGSTLRLPVGVGTIADPQSMKDAISSGIVAMQAMGSSIRPLCLKLEEVNSMVAELANICAKERALIRICKDFLSMLTALKVKDCSLRTHMLQTIRV